MTTHIKREDTVSWCDQPIDAGFHFANAEAAVLNGKHDKNPRACAACTAVLIGYLLDGREYAP